MKKYNALLAFILSTLFLLPFGKVSVAQTNGYVGVEQGKEYQWRISLNFDGIGAFVDNVPGLLDEIETWITELDLFGLESLTVPEAMENITHTIASTFFPFEWEDMNISTLFHTTFAYYITEFNNTILCGEIPSDWKFLNYSEFVDAVIDGLNNTLTPGWEDEPIPYLIQLGLNEFNSSLLFGLLPEGWEIMTLQELFENIIQSAVPEPKESFLTYLTMDQIIELIFAELPPGSEEEEVRNLLSIMIQPLVGDMNLTTMRDEIWIMFNSSLPPGWDSESISALIDYQVDDFNSSMPHGFDLTNMSTFIRSGIDETLYNMTLTPPPPLPDGWEDYTILELVGVFIDAAKAEWSVIATEFEAVMAELEFYGVDSMKFGLKIAIESIGAEVEAYPGGPKATPITMNIYVSLDMQTWESLSEFFENLTSSLSMAEPIYDNETIISILPEIFLNLTQTPYIVDPSSYSDLNIALYDQAALTYGLIVATNYNWTEIITETTIPTAGNPDAFKLSAEWNKNGLLKTASLKSDGLTVVSINYYTGEGEIPGFEVTTLLIVIPATIIGIIYYMRRKYK